MKIDLSELRKRKEYISEQRHPTLPLLIFNYTNRCQFDKAWDEFTMMSRGLIIDLDGNVVARPFKKFFNINEREETKVEKLPLEDPIITEKLDGSLGIQYYDGERVCIATRGSFTSEQAVWATEWMKNYRREDFLDGVTYLYEIIYPENRIVVNYGDRRELVLIAAHMTETEEMVDMDVFHPKGISCAKNITKTLPELISGLPALSGNEEGYVCFYPTRNLRVKMKGEEYVRLHRLITGFSTKSIWECLMNGQELDDILKSVPDEFYDWVNKKRYELLEQYADREIFSGGLYKDCAVLGTRKEQALLITETAKKFNAPWLSGVVFAMLDKKPYHGIIWKSLKPKWELPFKKEI